MDTELIRTLVMKYMVSWVRLHMPQIGNHDIRRTDAVIFLPLNTSKEWDITAYCKI